MIKKYIGLFIILFLVCSCSTQQKSDLLTLINSFSIKNNYQVEVYNHTENSKSTFVISNHSFIVNDTTYYKYFFKDGYQIYNQVETLENQRIDIEYGICFSSLIQKTKYTSNNFSINNDVYILNKSAYSIFDVSFLNENLEYFEVTRNKDNISIKLNFLKNQYSLNYSLIEKEIFPFGFSNDFYNKTNISFKNLKEKICNNESFVAIISSKNCSACVANEKYYELFEKEFNYDYFYSLEENYLSTSNEEVQSFLQDINYVYKNQKKELKHPSYDEYPTEYFLTPTALRFINGELKYVYLGFNRNNVNAFYDFCFEE